MTYENFLLTQLEKRANRLVKEAHDPEDKVTFDVPLFIRLLELAREDIKSDADLHHVVDRVLAIKDRGTLTMDDYEEIHGGVDYVDIRDSGTILIGYNSTGSVQIGNPEGGTLTEIVSEKLKFLLQAVPVTSVGAAGDGPGLVAFDGTYVYYCAGTYNGVDNIWKRIQWSNDTW